MGKLELQLANTQERLRLTLQSSGIGLWSWDIGPDVIEADDNCSVLFGLPKGRFPRTIEGFLELVQADDRERVQREVSASAERGEQYNTEFHVMWSEGSVRSLASHGKAYEGKGGRPQRITGVCWDVTERRQVEADLQAATKSLAAETKFRGLLDAAPDAMVVADEAGNIVLASSQVEKLFGYRREELLGRAIETLIPERFRINRPGRRAGFFANVEEPAMGTGEEVFGLRKDGTEFPIEVSFRRVETEEGILVSSAIRDVSDRKRKERQIQSVVDLSDQKRAERQTERDERQTERDELQTERDERQTRNVTRLEDVAAVSEAANQAKSMFLSTMSHEIRTPLNAILGYSQLMLRDPSLGIDSKANLKIINRSGEHLLSLINAVLDMSKIEAGRTEINSITFSLRSLLDDLENMFRLRAEAKSLHFAMLVDGESIPYVVADEGKIRQVLINLLGNAIKFTEHGRVELHVTVEQREVDRFWLVARVEDTGSGVTEEELRKLFQPFAQTKGGLNTQQGTGLGLAISRQHARLMGGDITFTARPAGGSVFLFAIPIEKGDPQVFVKRTGHARVIRLRAGQEVRRILVVDDHFENQNWLVRLLTAVGFSARGANDGEEGIRIWREWNPRLILMDVHMPVMDGLEATRRIKADPGGKETSIIILTASALDEERRIASQSGADDFLAKPCREDELLESIRVLLGAVFDYEENERDDRPVGTTAAPSADGLGQLPAELLEKLREATYSGNKKLLNQLIARVRDTAGDTGTVLTLQQLADKYEYDALTRLIEEACRP